MVANRSSPIALTIAGSDSGGGAGIQADLKTFQAFGVFGTSVIVALTAQNTLGVHGVHLVPEEFVRMQFDAVVSDLRPNAGKSGMLATAALVEGGHLVGDDVVDVLCDGHSVQEWRRPKLRTLSTHGTGCTLSAAVTAGLARGFPLTRAVTDALDYVSKAIASAPRIGAGNG